MNWGKGIVIAMSSFVIFILYLVFTLMSKNTDLESEDYYKKEIEFEQEIKASQNTNGLAEKIKITQDESYLVIQLPSKEKVDSIEVQLLRPDDQKQDVTMSFENTKNLMIPKKDLKKGSFQLRLHFMIGENKHFYVEDLKID